MCLKVCMALICMDVFTTFEYLSPGLCCSPLTLLGNCIQKSLTWLKLHENMQDQWVTNKSVIQSVQQKKSIVDDKEADQNCLS